MKILVNCGDSWANGDYSWIDTTSIDYSTKPFITNSYMYRLITDFIKPHRVFWNACGGSSNMEQVYKLKKFINDQGVDFFKNNSVVVFFGITSVSRLFLNNKTYYTQKESFDFYQFQQVYMPFDNELSLLNTELQFIHNFFKSTGSFLFIYNAFVPYKLENLPLMFDGKDLLSLLVGDSSYIDIRSDMTDNDWKTQKAKNLGLLDPKTQHPSKQGSDVIFKLMKKYLEKKDNWSDTFINK